MLNYLPKSVQAPAKAGLHDIWMAETKANAETAFDRFVTNYGAKYPRNVRLCGKSTAPAAFIGPRISAQGVPAPHARAPTKYFHLVKTIFSPS